MTKHLYGLILLVGISFVSTSVHSEVFRWIDEQGNVHFGDKAHANKHAQDITQETQLKNLDHSAARTQQSLQQIELRQQAQSTESQQRDAQISSNSTRHKQACSDAKQRLRTIQGRVYFVDDNGQEMNVTEKERQQRADALQKQIKQYCR